MFSSYPYSTFLPVFKPSKGACHARFITDSYIFRTYQTIPFPRGFQTPPLLSPASNPSTCSCWLPAGQTSAICPLPTPFGFKHNRTARCHFVSPAFNYFDVWPVSSLDPRNIGRKGACKPDISPPCSSPPPQNVVLNHDHSWHSASQVYLRIRMSLRFHARFLYASSFHGGLVICSPRSFFHFDRFLFTPHS